MGAALAAKYGGDAASLFEVSMKSNLLILLYQPGQDRGIGEVIKIRCEEIELPKDLWRQVVDAIDSKALSRTRSSRCTTTSPIICLSRLSRRAALYPPRHQHRAGLAKWAETKTAASNGKLSWGDKIRYFSGGLATGGSGSVMTAEL